jgi:hypothetical protein
MSFAVAAFSAHAEQPQIGDIFDITPGDKFRGWTLIESGIGLHNQPYSVFMLNDKYLVAVTVPVVRTGKGGVAVEKIAKILEAAAMAGEIKQMGHDCSFIGIDPALAFYNAKTKIARGLFVVRDDVLTKRWIVDEAHGCEYTGD